MCTIDTNYLPVVLITIIIKYFQSDTQLEDFLENIALSSLFYHKYPHAANQTLMTTLRLSEKRNNHRIIITRTELNGKGVVVIINIYELVQSTKETGKPPDLDMLKV